jgi:dTDP-4-dehydrorhamnose reductase
MNRNSAIVVLVTGASGQLGMYLLQELARRKNAQVHAWSGRTTGSFAGVTFEPVALEGRALVDSRLSAIRPDVILHAGAVSASDVVRQNPEHGRRVNVDATRTLADWCDVSDARLIFTSTDLVFDGTKSFWTEIDPAFPVLEYGRTKAEAESIVAGIAGGLSARISLLYGPTLTGRPSFFTACLDALKQGESRGLFVDEWRTPLDYLSAAEILCELALNHPEKHGIVHVGGPERMSRYELILRAATVLGIDPSRVRPVSAAGTAMPEPRPCDVSLSIARLRDWLPDRAERRAEETAETMK